MEYIDVQWLHANPGDPIRLMSELDCHRYETRKLEFFSTGIVGSASGTSESENTRLGVVPMPSLEEINADPQFRGVPIQRELFESLWKQHAGPDA